MSKIILITGVSSGLGKHTAEYLAQQGYKVYGTTRRDIGPNPRITILNVDVTDVLSVQRAVDSILQKEGRIDALINNAGMGLSGAIEDYSTDEAHREMDTNFYGTFHTIQTVLPAMRKQGSGMIINISSIAGKEVYENGNVYCATKYAVDALTKGMRMDLVDYNIKVTSIAPGAVETEFSLVRFKGDENRAAKVYEGFTPLSAEDIAEAILFAVTRPPHVNVNDMLIMPTAQANMFKIHRQLPNDKN